MLRLSKSSLGLVGLVFAVSASVMMLVSVPDEAAAKGLRISKHHSNHSTESHPDASSHREHAEDEVAQAPGGDAPSISIRPKGFLSGEDEAGKEPASAKVINNSGEAPVEAERETSPAMAEGPSESTADNATPSSGPQSPTVKTDASPATEPVPETAENKSPADGAAPNTAPNTAQAKSKPDVVKQHPIAATQPGMDVVVCEAGCVNTSETPNAIYVQPTTVRAATTSVAELQPTSTAPAAVQDAMKDMIVCLGGCYDTPKVYRSTLASPDTGAGAWTATVVPMNATSTGTGSGAWMRRIDASRETEPAKPQGH